MEVKKILKELDLTETESEIYLTLLKKGEGTASSTAKKSGVQRRQTYDIMEKLKEKGLVSYRDQENKRIYSATTPKRLKELVEERKNNLIELEEKIDDILPQLTKQYSEDSDEREVKVLEGKEGVKQLFNDEIREEETIKLIGSPEESEELLKYFLPTWTEKRQEKEIKIKGIFEHSMKGDVGEHQPIETRFLPPDYKSKVSMAVYGDKVGITFWLKDPLVIMINDQQAAQSFHNYFKIIWKNSAKPE